MSDENRDFPNYYDGSSHAEFAGELTDGLAAQPQELHSDAEQWRRVIAANPFGANQQQP